MDVLEIVEILEEQGFKNKKAIKLAEAINGKSGLATKEDIGLLKEDINKVESSLKEDINKVESSLKENINKVENRIGRLETSNKWIVAVLFLILSLLVKVAFFT